MKKPKLSDLKVDLRETKRIRSAMASQKNVKITINIDSQTLKKLKSIAAHTGVPYQRLLNRTLQESLAVPNKDEQRLDRMEKEISMLKRKIAA